MIEIMSTEKLITTIMENTDLYTKNELKNYSKEELIHLLKYTVFIQIRNNQQRRTEDKVKLKINKTT